MNPLWWLFSHPCTIYKSARSLFTF